MAASYDFVQLDVFTRTPLAGNPLAVFTDARGLTDKQMQALAREMNLSETTFILPREPEVEATNGKRVRIFTTAFPRTVFGNADRRAAGRTLDQAGEART